MRKRRIVAALVASGALFWSGSAAWATGTIECTGAAGADASVFLLVGRLPVLAVLRAEIETEGTVYATDPPNGADAVRIAFGQGFTDANRLVADFTDPNFEEIVITLRLERAFEDKAGAEAGIVRVVGEGAWPVTCESG